MRVQSAMPVVSSSGPGSGAHPALDVDVDVDVDVGGKGLPLRLGVLTDRVAPELVDEVVAAAGVRERRRRLLPARAVVYFVLGLALFSGADSVAPPGYRSVLAAMTAGVRERTGVGLATRSALTRARARLGSGPLWLLFTRIRGPLAGVGTPGAFAFGLRLVAFDGTELDAADTARNGAAFGRRTGAGNPQLRLLALIECATHAVIDAAFDSVTRASEHALARRVAGSLQAGMLVLADRNFPGHDLWGLAADTGADLAWRVKKNHLFDPVREFDDGSYLAVLPDPAAGRRRARARAAGRASSEPLTGHTVRVIEYTVTATGTDGTVRTEPFRLLTTLLDPDRAPADALAVLYHQRWENENGYGEFKTRLRGAGFVLRSGSPDLVEQELFAFLIVYQLLSALRTAAATRAGIDPRRVSFTVTLRTARAHAGTGDARHPASLTRARAHAITDLLADLLPPRRSRRCERLKKPPKNTFRSKKPDHSRPPDKITYVVNVTKNTPSPA